MIKIIFCKSTCFQLTLFRDDRDAEEHHHCVDQQLDAMARMCESLEQLKTGTYALYVFTFNLLILCLG